MTSSYNWHENSKGNFVCIDGYEEAVATVFCNAVGVWQIAINNNPRGTFVDGAAYDIHEEAMERAESILDGAHCEFALPTTPRPDTTDWKEQRKKVLGRPTYGRRSRGISASVRVASSGKWFFLTYDKSGDTSKPNGWFETAQMAMAAFDQRYG